MLQVSNGSLAQFNFELQYQKGHNTRVVDALSQVTTCLDLDMVKSILNSHLGISTSDQVHNPAIVHVTDWVETQKEDPTLSVVLNWLKTQKKTELKLLLVEHTSSEEGRLILCNQQNSQFIKELCICAQCPKVRLRIFYSLWSPRPIGSPP